MISTIAIPAGQSGSLASRAFVINSLRIDNLTTFWYNLVGTSHYFPPYTIGIAADIRGFGAVRLVQTGPPGTAPVNPFTNTAGEFVYVTASDDVVAASPGWPYRTVASPLGWGESHPSLFPVADNTIASASTFPVLACAIKNPMSNACAALWIRFAGPFVGLPANEGYEIVRGESLEIDNIDLLTTHFIGDAATAVAGDVMQVIWAT